jgi:hypothetical protein
MGPEDLNINDELLSQLSAATMDKAMKRLQNEEGVRIFKNLIYVDPSQFVIVKAPGI